MKIIAKYIIIVLITVFAFSFSSIYFAKAENETLIFYNNYEKYTLQDSEYFKDGENNDKASWYGATNCYYYAINRYNRQYSTNGIWDLTYAHNPGYFAYGQVTDADTIENLVNNVKADLTALCGKDILVSTEKPVVKDGYHLIALRMGENEIQKDYHFMKYNPIDGYWYHKPGTAGKVLRYKYEVNNERIWANEFVGMGDEPMAPTLYYSSEIYYIMFKEALTMDPVDGYYEIYSYEALKSAFSESKLRCMRLMKHITIPSSDPWKTIKDYNETFDGNGYTISGLRLNIETGNLGQTQNIGFFGEIDAIIKNLTFDNVEIKITGEVKLTGEVNIGVIAGTSNTVIENCKVGNLRIYGEVNLSSNASANIGGLCGINNGTVSESQANYLHIAGFGNLGGMTGKNNGKITSCSVNNSSVSLYHGTAGGIAGKNEETGDNTSIENCEVNNTTISCYNGYPDALPKYYPSEHNAMIGGVCGWNDRGAIKEAKVNNCTIAYNGGSTDSKSLAPEMGLICGRSSKGAQISGTVTGTEVNKGELRVMEWWEWVIVKKQYDQGKYAGNRNIGREE